MSRSTEYPTPTSRSARNSPSDSTPANMLLGHDEYSPSFPLRATPFHATPHAPPPTPVAGSSSSDPSRRGLAEVHVSDGNYNESQVFAYVYLEHAVHSPHHFIRQAMEQACGAPAFTLAASGRGAGIMEFRSREEREQVVSCSPISFGDNRITVERHEEVDNRFYAFYHLYAEIAAVDFPLEHWEEELAREVLSEAGNVCCIDSDCLKKKDFTSMCAVLRLDHGREVPEQLLVRNHSGLATITNLHVIRAWVDGNPMADFNDYQFNRGPVLHTPPTYHPGKNPPTQLPPNPENLVASVLDVETRNVTPPLRPVHTKQPTPYPTAAASQPVLALPGDGAGGVVEEEDEEEVDVGVGETVGADTLVEGLIEEAGTVAAMDNAVTGLAALNMEGNSGAGGAADVRAVLDLEVPPTFVVGGRDAEPESMAAKKRAKRRARNSARKLRRSLRCDGTAV